MNGPTLIEQTRAIINAVLAGPNAMVEACILASLIDNGGDWASADPHLVLAKACKCLIIDVAPSAVNVARARQAASDLGIKVAK